LLASHVSILGRVHPSRERPLNETRVPNETQKGVRVRVRARVRVRIRVKVRVTKPKP
jgi:hypothetical protein